MRKLFYLAVSLIGLLYAAEAFATAFTSVQTGNWNDGATWGLTSPGVKGTDWPGTAADTFTVAATHVVTYNFSEANALGNSTVTGTLKFSRGMTTLLTLGSANTLTISNGGWLDMGASGDEIPAAYNAELVCDRAATGNVIIVSNGGKFTAQGDSAFYGSDGVTYLANNAENTDGDVDIITTEDMSAKWAAGQLLMVQIKKTYTDSTPRNSVFGTALFTIDSISGTTITSTATTITADAGVGDTWTGIVVNLSRNVIIREKDASSAIGTWATVTGVIYNSNATVKQVTLEDVRLHGMSYEQSVTASTAPGADFVNCTNHNTQYAFKSSWNTTTWSGDYAVIASPEHAYYSTAQPYGTITSSGYILTGSTAIYANDDRPMSNISTSATIIGCTNAFVNTVGVSVTSPVIACCFSVHLTATYNMSYVGTSFWGNDDVLVVAGGNLRIRNCYFYENSGDLVGLGARSGDLYVYNVKLGYDSTGTSKPNTGTDDFVFDTTYAMNLSIYAYNVKMESGETTFNTSITNAAVADTYCRTAFFSEHHDQVLNAHLTQTAYFIIEKVAFDGTGDRPSVDPDAGTGDGLEVRDVQSNLSDGVPILVLRQRFWKTAAAYTITYPVQTTYDELTQDELRIHCYYASTGSAGTVGYATDTSAVAVRTNDADWTQSRSCTFTQGEAGWVTIELWLNSYEASDEVWIWPEPTWS